MIHVSAQEEMTSNGIGERSRHILFHTTSEGCGSPKRRPLSKYTKRKHEETNTLKGPISAGGAVQEKRLQRDQRRRNGV